MPELSRARARARSARSFSKISVIRAVPSSTKNCTNNSRETRGNQNMFLHFPWLVFCPFCHSWIVRNLILHYSWSGLMAIDTAESVLQSETCSTRRRHEGPCFRLGTFLLGFSENVALLTRGASCGYTVKSSTCSRGKLVVDSSKGAEKMVTPDCSILKQQVYQLFFSLWNNFSIWVGALVLCLLLCLQGRTA